MTARIANTVVYRHPCDCEHASRPLADGEHAEHRFDVDGEPFPWHISEEGATFAEAAAGGYVLVAVRLLPLARSNNEWLRVVLGVAPETPLTFEHVDGTRRPFPWAILAGTLSIDYTEDLPVVSLTFIAEHVDVDAEVTPLEDTATP